MAAQPSHISIFLSRPAGSVATPFTGDAYYAY